MANNYCDLTTVKAYMPANEVSTVTTWDQEVTDLCQRMSRQFDVVTNRKPGAYNVTVDVTRYFDGPGYGLFSPVYGYKTQRLSSGYTGAMSLRVGEIAAAPTEVAMAQTGVIATAGGSGTYTAVPATDYYMEPQNAADDGHPFTTITLDIVNGSTRVWLPYKRGIRVIGKFGYAAATPDDVKEAVILMVVRELRRNQQNYTEVAAILDSGQVMTGAKVDQTINLAIETYRRPAV